MTKPEVIKLFVVLTGYWRSSSPEVDDPIAVAGYADILATVDLADAIDTAREMAKAGERFCPDPGELYAAIHRKPALVAPYHRKWEDRLMDPYDEQTAIEETSTGRVDVKSLLDDARSQLRGGPS